MKKVMLLGSLLLLAILAIQCGPQKIQLWNDTDFSGWEMFTADETVDAKSIWSITDGVIHCKGVPTGYIRTKADYSDYILTLDWRWTEKPGNSGVLLHSKMPDQVWPNCLECQLKADNAGDFVLIGPGSIDVDGKTFNNTERFLASPKKNPSNEAEIGEWNSYKIICKGDGITCYVNGVLQNEGTKSSHTSGKIGLQSEGAPIEFRKIVLQPLR